MTYYQPFAYSDDGTNITYGSLPEELYSFMAFLTREDCEDWLADNGYDPGDFAIIEYHDDDIEDVTLLDAYGSFIDGTGSVSCYNTEKDLDEGYDKLYGLLKKAKDGGKDIIDITPCTLYEDGETLCSNGHHYTDFPDERPTIVQIDTVCIYTDRGEGFPLENITDCDDYDMLYDAVVLAVEKV